MKRILLAFALLLTITNTVYAQSTTVSGQVTDAGGQTWNNGKVIASFVPIGTQNVPYVWTGGAFGLAQQTVTGNLNGSGAYSISVPSSTAITPVGTKWLIVVYSNTTPQSSASTTITISGATQTINFTPAAISISASSGTSAYADGEVSATVGQTYYNLTTSTLRICTAAIGSTCSAWTGAGGGGGASYGTGGGTAQAQTVTPTPTVSALTTGLEVCWLPAAANTAAAPTLAVSGLTAKPITKYGTIALVANDITTTGIACAIYDGTEFQLQVPFAGVVARSSVQAVGTAAQAMNLYVSGGCDGISACTGNFWGIQAPASLAASLQYTGNLTDGSGNSSFVTDGSQHLSTVQLPQYIAGAGAADAMTATFVPAFSAYAAGEEFDVMPNLANTLTNPTLNVNNLGAKTVTKCGTAVLAAGDWTTTAVAKFIYDGTRMQLQNPQAAGCGGATGALAQVPATTAANTVAPTANSVVGLTVLATTGTATDMIRVCGNSAGACGNKYFSLDLSGYPNYFLPSLTMDTNNFTDIWRANDTGARIHDFSDSSGFIENTIAGCTNVTPVTVNANVATDQLLMACAINAKALNAVNRTLRFSVAGTYSTPAASTSVLTFKAKLCSVSGCGSGTVITPISIATAALGALQATNDPFNFTGIIATQTTGASSAYEADGVLTIDIASTASAAATVYPSGNTATVGTIDNTAQMFLQITAAASNASASNSFTQRHMTVEVIN